MGVDGVGGAAAAGLGSSAAMNNDGSATIVSVYAPFNHLSPPPKKEIHLHLPFGCSGADDDSSAGISTFEISSPSSAKSAIG